MHLSLFALAITILPAAQVAQPPPAPAPTESVVVRPAGRLAIRLGLRTRGPSPANAALTFSRLLGDLRDSLGRSRAADPALPIEIRSLLPTASEGDRRGKEYELSLALTLGPDALPTFLQVLDHLASGSVTVSDLRLGAEGELTELADQMLQAAADSGTGPPAVGGTIGRLGRLALLLLAIRKEVRQ
ncbi:MAG: hypothetical protein ABIQ41_06665 [Gemmatimonadales bacterium]